MARPGGGGGDSHMKVTGMLVVSLRRVNCRFWSRLGFTGRKANILTCTGIASGCALRNVYMKNQTLSTFSVNLKRN